MSSKEKAVAVPAPAPPPAGALPAAPQPEVEAPKVRRERKKGKPKINVQVWKLYKLSENSVERLRKECPRCGHGFFMAEHSDRLSCGHCGYTSFKTKA